MSAHLDPAVAEQIKDIRQSAEEWTGSENRSSRGAGSFQLILTGGMQFAVAAQETPLKLLRIVRGAGC